MAEGFDVIGFDIECHEYWVPDTPEAEGYKGTKPQKKRGWTQGCAVSLGMEGDGKRPATKLLRYPGQLVIQDVTTLHGSQFKDAALIVASPPCQAYSYRAMPWKRAKALPPPSNMLFETCFRIQREACEAAGRHIPLIVENVRGAQKWVGRARWNFGSFYLWGDVPALMPSTIKAQKFNPDGTAHPSGSWFKVADSKNRGARSEGQKVPSQSGRRTDLGKGARFTSRDCGVEVVAEGRKGAGAGAEWFDQNLCQHGSKSLSRKHASAMIAKIPLPLARHIAKVFHP